MAELTLPGTNRTRYLNDVRGLREFQVTRGVTLTVKSIWTASPERLAWVECEQGTWRLPAVMFGWALEVEERAMELVGHAEIFPCRLVFEPHEDGSGHFDAEIFPPGYRSPFR